MTARASSPVFVASVAAGLLVLGLAADLGLARRERREVASLRAANVDLAEELLGRAIRLRESKRVFEYVESGRQSAGKGLSRDAIDFIGAELDRQHLRRLEIGTQDVAESDGIRRTRIFLRATGSFGRTLRFISRLEGSPRLVDIQAFSIKETVDQRVLELRLDLVVVDELGESR